MKVQIGTILYRDESGEPTDSVPLYDDLPNDAPKRQCWTRSRASSPKNTAG